MYTGRVLESFVPNKLWFPLYYLRETQNTNKKLHVAAVKKLNAFWSCKKECIKTRFAMEIGRKKVSCVTRHLCDQIS